MRPFLLFVFTFAATVSSHAQIKMEEVNVTLHGTVQSATGAYSSFAGLDFTNSFTTSVRPFLDLEGSFLYSALTHIKVGDTTVFNTTNFQADYVEVWTGAQNRFGMTQSSRADLGFHYSFIVLGTSALVEGNHLRANAPLERFDTGEGWLTDGSGSLTFQVSSFDVVRPNAAVPEPSTYGVGAILLICAAAWKRHRRIVTAAT